MRPPAGVCKQAARPRGLDSGAVTRPTFHLRRRRDAGFLRLADCASRARSSRSAAMRFRSSAAGSSFGSCGTSLPENAALSDDRIRCRQLDSPVLHRRWRVIIASEVSGVSSDLGRAVCRVMFPTETQRNTARTTQWFSECGKLCPAVGSTHAIEQPADRPARERSRSM